LRWPTSCADTAIFAPTPPPVEPPIPVTATRTWPCPRCGAPMRLVERLTARQLFLEAVIEGIVYDTS
jgi:hypothetical protein